MRGRKPANIKPDVSPVEKVPTAPAWLSKDAKAEWRRVCPILVNERRTLSEADLPTLAAYCAAVGQVQEASRILAKEGLTYSSDSGMPKKHPAVGIRHDAMTQVRQLGGELGLTPVSRSRPAMRDSHDPEDASDLDL
ncbi:phage terminase small subunit P27 family [Xanthobacter sp. KR7-225]|uniref:phage terminase small subunit P27 family n=1 Tax=Xanthobacter sp. KR7-225 TaxID=3156613 RepID=UPI0032B31D9C